MRYIFLSLALVCFTSCDKKKTDTALFNEGKTHITLTASPPRGYEPLNVSFEAYLENKERVLTKEIVEAKWVISGPNGFLREVVHTAENLQEGENNEDDSFYLDFQFFNHGRYSVKLVLNKGEYISNPLVVMVMERETDERYRNRY